MTTTSPAFAGTFPAWVLRADRLVRRSAEDRHPPVVAVLTFLERAHVRGRFGPAGVAELLVGAAERIGSGLGDSDVGGVTEDDGLVVLLRGCGADAVQARLGELVQLLAGDPFVVSGEPVRVTPSIGWSSVADGPATGGRPDVPAAARRAVEAAGAAARRLDLVPLRWAAAAERATRPRGTVALLGLTVVLGVLLPLAGLLALHRLGVDLGMTAYWLVTASLGVTATAIWAEGIHALDPPGPPDGPAADPPPATAIICAYLPNEAATIMETVGEFLAHDYPGGLQVVLAYNTPHPLPVEDELRDLATRDPRLVALRVPFSTSKAQNVNAALLLATGSFTGLFDADHHPEPGAFLRAWRWISHGVDMVQGHCLVRNGDSSAIARTVAVEFEAIYAVSHPGRAALHGFAVFGGSGGFWRTSVLRATRMRPTMLTEDIDSSIRVVLGAGRTAMDPGLLSSELAPTTVRALWHQRLRWAQGWTQVSRAHLGAALRAPGLDGRARAGMLFLLGWREVYPWIALQMLPVLAFLAWRAGGLHELDFLVPALVLTTLYTMSVGPAQTLFAWRLAAPQLRRHPSWFLRYVVWASLVYPEFRNAAARVAHLRELAGHHPWVVTPRGEERS